MTSMAQRVGARRRSDAVTARLSKSLRMAGWNHCGGGVLRFRLRDHDDVEYVARRLGDGNPDEATGRILAGVKAIAPTLARLRREASRPRVAAIAAAVVLREGAADRLAHEMTRDVDITIDQVDTSLPIVSETRPSLQIGPWTIHFWRGMAYATAAGQGGTLQRNAFTILNAPHLPQAAIASAPGRSIHDLATGTLLDGLDVPIRTIRQAGNGTLTATFRDDAVPLSDVLARAGGATCAT